jgi:hypothetical protein
LKDRIEKKNKKNWVVGWNWKKKIQLKNNPKKLTESTHQTHDLCYEINITS